MNGKLSIFGGKGDKGMTLTEGLSLYEHDEANHRPDLFYARGEDPKEGTSQRLRLDALFFAWRFPKPANRINLQGRPWKFTNPKNGLSVGLWLVDWGPHERTGRTFDISPRAAELLKVKTDEKIDGDLI